MTEVEIREELTLAGDQQRAIELHSFVNLANVINAELQIAELLLEDDTLFVEERGMCRALIDSYRDMRDEAQRAERTKLLVARLRERIAEVVEDGIARKPATATALTELRVFVLRVLAVVDVRILELLARMHAPGAWQHFADRAIVDQVRQIFDVMTLGARGRYAVVYPPSVQTSSEYLLDIRVDCPDGSVYVPPEMLDVMRDLTANARKYSPPGTRVQSRIEDDRSVVRLEVRDEGRGIPPQEISSVVQFGIRGSNTSVYETKGSGFGLTKAYYIARRYHGRMWIASSLGEGTNIRIEIPTPAESADR